MAQNDLLKRYIDAGVSFTALTQSRAERLVRELVKAGELQADQAREAVVDLVERSRKSSERLIELISAEVRSQITVPRTRSPPVRDWNYLPHQCPSPSRNTSGSGARQCLDSLDPPLRLLLQPGSY
jgi:polyhydroxyalkanoate synthesis regulator phasin